jgi:anti-anti-sigma factor
LTPAGNRTVMSLFAENRHEVGASSYRVIEVYGECGLPDVDALQVTLDATDGSEAGIVIGLEHCEAIDSMALAALVRARARGRAGGREFVMAAPSAQVRRVLQVSRLDTDGLVFDSVDEALAAPVRL